MSLMRRRAFVLGAAAVASCGAARAARAQQPAGGGARPVLLFLSSAPVGLFDELQRGLAARGYADGRTIVVQRRIGQLAAASADIAAGQVDVIVAVGPDSLRAARALTAAIPIVAYDMETDPLAEGYAASFARPGGNVTGVFLDQPSVAGKWLQYLGQAVPRLSSLAALWDPVTPPAQLRATQAAASELGIGLRVFALGPDLEALFSAMTASGAQGVVLLSSPGMYGARARLADLARRAALPSVCMFREFAQEGGLLAYGPDFRVARRRTVDFVERVRRGQAPGEIPLERPAKFNLVLNLSTAAALGLTVPPALLAEADEVIE